MSRTTAINLMLLIAAALLAIALFIAGAVWRGRVTIRPKVHSANGESLMIVALLRIIDKTPRATARILQISEK